MILRVTLIADDGSEWTGTAQMAQIVTPYPQPYQAAIAEEEGTVTGGTILVTTDAYDAAPR